MTQGATPLRGSFLARYQAGELNDLYGLPAGAIEAALARPRTTPRDALTDALRVQAEERGDHPAQRAAIDRLRHPDARAIVAGQQAGLLLGPTFSLTKALTAIRLAERHDRGDRPVVPVFWVASQDHDAAEIDHAFLLDRSERLQRASLPFPPDLPSGRTPLTGAWHESLRVQLAELDVPPEPREAAMELLASAWEGARNVGDLFARILSSLLGVDGLVVLDPMRPEMARLFRPVLEAELAAPAAGPEAIRTAGEVLRERGERPQLGRGRDATNLFLQESGGPRRALRLEDGVLRADGHPERSLRKADLLALLDEDPAAITPAAGLRPVVQDAVLPTVATVVGPGELKYFAQLGGVYRHHGVDMPLVWPRATVTLLEPPVVRILERHGITAHEFMDDPRGTLRAAVLRTHGHARRFRDAAERVERDTEAMLAEVAGLDPTLAGPVERGREVLSNTVQRLRDKSADALARRDDVTSRQFARLGVHLLPHGAPQERVLSPFSFFLKFGVGATLNRLRTIPAEGDHVVTIDPG